MRLVAYTKNYNSTPQMNREIETATRNDIPVLTRELALAYYNRAASLGNSLTDFHFIVNSQRSTDPPDGSFRLRFRF